MLAGKSARYALKIRVCGKFTVEVAAYAVCWDSIEVVWGYDSQNALRSQRVPAMLTLDEYCSKDGSEETNGY